MGDVHLALNGGIVVAAKAVRSDAKRLAPWTLPSSGPGIVWSL